MDDIDMIRWRAFIVSCAVGPWSRFRAAVVAVASLLYLAIPGYAASRCDDEQTTRQVPTNLALCAKLEPIVRKPSALPADHRRRIGSCASSAAEAYPSRADERS